tara:strand:- start:126 stop:908 length:783 start_codon:yes stop_codon:yes gene_type:complete
MEKSKAKKSGFLEIILAGYLAVAPSLQNSALADSPDKTMKGSGQPIMGVISIPEIKKEVEPVRDATIKTTVIEQENVFNGFPDYVKRNYDCIKRNFERTNKVSVNQMRKVSSDLEKSIKKHGLDKTVKIDNQRYLSCLDLALQRMKSGMTDKDFDERTKKISMEFYEGVKKANVSGPIDFTRDVVILAGQKKVILDTLSYEKLLSSEINSPVNYNSLVRSVFTEKEYSKLTEEQISATGGIYEALKKSTVGFKGLFAGVQ